MNEDKLYDFYKTNLNQHGSNARGVGWKNEEAQTIRFWQLYKLMVLSDSFSLNDLGCGVGDFVGFLLERKTNFEYRGYDLLEEMVQLAKKKYEKCTPTTFECVNHAGEMRVADFTIASGIFNIKFEMSEEEWLKKIISTIEQMNAKSNKGFAFNMLSKYSDLEYRKGELYYGDPTFFFDFCKKRFSKNVALLHDYDQYDFTMIVRK